MPNTYVACSILAQTTNISLITWHTAAALISLLTSFCRCDRKKPCSACTRHNVDCIFDPLQPPRNRDRRLSNQILTERLRHYEALLREKGIDPPKLQHTPDSEPRRSTSHTTAVSPNELQFDIPRSIEAESSRSVNKAQIIRDEERFKFVDK